MEGANNMALLLDEYPWDANGSKYAPITVGWANPNPALAPEPPPELPLVIDKPLRLPPPLLGCCNKLLLL